MSSLTCDIVTPVAELASVECAMVVVPGTEGEMGFLEGHAPTVSTLADGVVRIHSDIATVSDKIVVMGGYAQVTGKKVIVLADRAMRVSEISLEDVAAKTAEAERVIAEGADTAEAKIAQVELKWQQLLSEVAKAS